MVETEHKLFTLFQDRAYYLILPIISIPFILGLPYLTKKFHKLYKHHNWFIYYINDNDEVIKLEKAASNEEDATKLFEIVETKAKILFHLGKVEKTDGKEPLLI